jgi:hypothetical protein
MIDDHDVALITWLWPIGRDDRVNWFALVLWLLVVGFVVWCYVDNLGECEAQVCEHGVARLLDGECVCVESLESL